MSFDPKALRRRFPVFAKWDGKTALRYLDNAATAQVPDVVLAAMEKYETTARANVHRGLYALAERAEVAYDQARCAVARFLNAPSPEEVIFTSGATASLNLLARALEAQLSEGDEILLSEAEHHSNLVPWQMLAARKNLRLRFLPLTADGRIDLAAIARNLSARCKLVALTHASNVTGAITDLEPIIVCARAQGALVILDGAQAAPHGGIDVQGLGCDFYAFSGHKCFGPNGIGVLWGRRALLENLPPAMGGGGMVREVTWEKASYADPPARFEAGTPPIGQAIGMGAALDFIMNLPHAEISAHYQCLGERLLTGLAEIPGLRLLGPASMARRLPVFSFSIPGLHPHDICQILAELGLALRGGHHCAQPLMTSLGVFGAVRASLAPYNDIDDIAALMDGLQHVLRRLG